MKIVKEVNYPIEDVLSEPSVVEIVEALKLSSAQLKKLQKSVVNIKVSTTKSIYSSLFFSLSVLDTIAFLAFIFIISAVYQDVFN